MAEVKWPRSFRDATELPADDVAALVEQLIAELDRREGDPDLEDSEAANPYVDERGNLLIPFDQVTPCQDEDREPDDDAQDIAWTEWHGRGSKRQRSALHETVGSINNEDDEEDDPSGQCDEDGINTCQSLIRYTPGSSGAGCPISDPDAEHDGREEEHLL